MATFAELINGGSQYMGPQQQRPGQSMAQVVNPMQANTGLDQTPPKDEADLQQRITGWQGFMQQMQTDPVLRNTMMTVGASLLAGPQFMGENTGSIFGRAIQNGLLSHQFGRAAEGKAKLAQKQEERADSLAQAQMEKEGAATEELRQKTQNAKEDRPILRRKKLAEADAAELQVKNAPVLFQSGLDTAASLRAKNYALANRANRPPEPKEPPKEPVIKPDALTLNAQANALSKLIESGASPERIKQAEEKLSRMLGLDEAAEPAANSPVTEEEFRAAARNADPEGWFMLRGERVKLKPGYKP